MSTAKAGWWAQRRAWRMLQKQALEVAGDRFGLLHDDQVLWPAEVAEVLGIYLGDVTNIGADVPFERRMVRGEKVRLFRVGDLRRFLELYDSGEAMAAKHDLIRWRKDRAPRVLERLPREQMPTVRYHIPARLRFAVLHRCRFACTYCGRKPPEVTLHIDHIVPVSKSGRTEEANLTAACRDCNLGKHAMLLGEDR